MNAAESDCVDAARRNVDSALPLRGRRGHRHADPGTPTADRGAPGGYGCWCGASRRVSGGVAAATAAQQRVERSAEVRVEDVVDDRVEHRAAVRQPLERHEDPRRQVLRWACPSVRSRISETCKPRWSRRRHFVLGLRLEGSRSVAILTTFIWATGSRD